ncbi:MAG: penicillin-binding transpeptidase domain-containing protein, partial [Paracoccus sp. (in: a-proteobacteria)]
VQDRRGRTVYRHDRRVCQTCGLQALPAGAAPVIESNRERVMDAVTAFQLTSMLEGAVQRGSGSGVNLPVPIAGKTGTTNDAKDVWFIGYSSNIVAGCYLGFDQPRTLGANAFGGTLCVPVFNAFMRAAVAEYGGTAFKVPPGGYWVKIDRTTGQRLPDNATGPNVISEYFRDGADPNWGVPLVVSGFGDGAVTLPWEAGADSRASTSITTSTGERRVIPRRTDFGTMSSGGLY